MSVHVTDSPAAASRPRLNLVRLREMAARDEPIAMLTCYEATLARLVDAAGVDVVLVGDSLGNVVQGRSSTLPVDLGHMAYHTECVARGLSSAWLIGDLPFGSYEASPQQALESAITLMRAGAQMVKLEGGGPMVETVRFLVDRGIPVCAHLGLTPQRVHALGGFRVQGRDAAGAETLVADAQAMAQAGAAMLVLELVPSAVARQVRAAAPGLITIGIGAGPDTHGQVLVLHDMLGWTPGRRPRFVHDFSRDGEHTRSVQDAAAAYVAEVKARRFPDPVQHGY